jgi:hypothetical protein
MTPSPELAILTCYFNPQRYQSRRENFETFATPLYAAGQPLFIVECAFGDAPFELTKRPGLIQLKGGDVLWQKERLLNILLEQVPASFKKIAWVDCDVLFTNPSWAIATSAALDSLLVVQPFSEIKWLPQGATSLVGGEQRINSFAYVVSGSKEAQHLAFEKHGHTGFAWAARREMLPGGLYDASIMGSADHLMAHAFCGEPASSCARRLLGEPHYQHFLQWAMELPPITQEGLGFIEGALLHLWHGELIDRRYLDRHQPLRQLHFDPTKDLRKNITGLWEWSGTKPKLREWAEEYFQLRREDG